jgi:hypothetical protein
MMRLEQYIFFLGGGRRVVRTHLALGNKWQNQPFPEQRQEQEEKFGCHSIVCSKAEQHLQD